MSQKPAKKSIFSKIRRSIWSVIKTAVVFVTFFVGGIVGKTYLELPPTLEKEKLEISEQKYLKSIFGDAINTNDIQKRRILEPFDDDRQIAFVLGFEKNDIRFIRDVYEDDFTTGTSENLRTLTHEANHIAENQQKGYAGMLTDLFMQVAHALTLNTHNDEYGYILKYQNPDLKTIKPFDSFGREQRASMVEDYAETFIIPYMKDVQNVLLYKADENQMILRQTVENKYPQAKITREKLEKGNPRLADLIYGRTKISLKNIPSI